MTYSRWSNNQDHKLSAPPAPSVLDYVHKGSSSLVGVVALLCMIGTAVLWFGKLHSSIIDLQSASQITVNRLDKIDESRSIGLQRLAKVEEAVSRIDGTLARMDAKLDRALDRGH